MMKLEKIKVGEEILFGHNGKESIEWIVLAEEDNKALLLSTKIIDCIRFSEFQSNTYYTSEIRRYFGEHLENMFTSEERKIMVLSVVDNTIKSTGLLEHNFLGPDCEDYLFCLSKVEFDTLVPKKIKQAFASDTAKENGIYRSEGGASRYWLRTPSNKDFKTSLIVDEFGEESEDIVDNTHIGIRPAMWIIYK